MLFLVSTWEYTGIGSQKMTVNYGIFSSEEKARNAISSICKKLAQIAVESDSFFTQDDFPKFKAEYAQNFDITKMPDVDNCLIMINKIPNW